MSAVIDDGADLERGFSALSQRFSRVSARLAEAGQALIDHHSLPDASLLEEIGAVRDEFEGLRARALDLAASLSLPLAGRIAELAELDVAVRSIVAESAERARVAEQEAFARHRAEVEARRKAEEDARRRAEEDAKRRAEEEARRKAAEEAKRRAEEEARRKTEEESRRKAEEEARRKADAEAKRKAEEEAAARRKAEEEARRTAEEAAKQKAAAEANRKADEEASARHKAEEAARQKAAAEAKRKAEEDATQKAAAQAEAKRKAEEAAKQKAAVEAKRKAEEAAKQKAAVEAKGKAEEDAKQKAAAEAKRKAEEDATPKAAAQAEAKRKAEEDAARRAATEEAIRKADEEIAAAERKAEQDAKQQGAAGEAKRKPGEDGGAPRKPEGADAKRKVDADAQRRIEEARRKLEEIRRRDPAAVAADAGDEAGLATAQWWVSASAAWGNLKSRNVRFADAVRDVLAKYDYVFSVPIQASTDYEDGLLAYGFAVLLEHVDLQVSGFVSEALNRLPVRKGATVGRRLYDYLGTPLKARYPEFVKGVMEAGLPRPGLWVNGGIEETETQTIVFQRASSQIGDPNQKADRITHERLRFAEHHFSVALAPLTTRFVRIDAKTLKEPRDVEIKMSEKGAPSDQAWIGVLSPRDMTPQTRRHDRQGSKVSGLGAEHSSVWIGLFNADPYNETRIELSVMLRPKAQAATLNHFRKK